MTHEELLYSQSFHDNTYNNKYITNLIVSKVMSERKITIKDPQEVRDNVSQILKSVDMINSIDEEASSISRYDLKDIQIIDEFKSMILPGAIRFDVSDYATKNVILKTLNPKEAENFSLRDFEEAQARFRAFFKKDLNTERTAISDLRQHVNLVDVLSRCAVPKVSDLPKESKKDGHLVDMRVRYVGSTFWPIILTVDMSMLFNDFYFNSVTDEVVEDYFARLRFA